MKKNFLFTVVFFLGFAEFTFGQKVTETAIIQATLTSIEQITIGTDASTYDENGSYEIGMEGDSVAVVVGKNPDGTDKIVNKYRKRIYRTFCEFVLTPINYTSTNHTVIKKVDVEYSTGGFGYTFKITQPNSKPTSSSEKWSTIGTSGALFSGITYSGSTINSTSGLISAVQNGLANNHVYLGLLSESESASGSNAKVHYITLKVTYERDRASISGTVQNDLYGAPAGKIYVDGILYDSPHAHAFYEGLSYALSAYSPQDHAGTGGTYTYIWHQGAVNTSKWIKKLTNTQTFDYGSNASVNYTTNLSENGAVFTAYMRRVCYATFNNSMPEGGGNSGYITVDGTQYNVTNVTTKIEGNSVKFWAQTNQSLINGIQPFFYKWAEDGSTSSARTETININKTYTAIYKGKPSTTDRSMRFNDGSYGSNVTLTWNTHPSTNAATCKIYRKAKVNGVMGNEMLIGTVPRGTTTFVDYDYVVSSNSTTQLFYDVRYVYTGTLPDNTQYTTESDPSFENIFGQIAVEIADNNEQKAEIVSEIPTEYSIGNFPNPFNPTTTIKYQLPEAGMVTLKVYDILGREVAELVNENKSAGYYEVNFDASKLTSGVYIYTIQAGRYSESKKMILTK